ncbi:hypothetical protein FRB99_006108 [Tulasnella sp. 403]|nr:hypothetical protein FRB99_006108 [Tulasnella sp. 403]
MSSEEDARSHGRLGSRTRASKTRAVSPAPWEEGRCIDVVQVEEPPDSPRLGMGTLFLPTSSVSPVTHPAGGPIGLKPPQPTPTGLNIASLVTESFGVTSSTNIRSPTTISFDPQSDASYSIIRRPKSHDSGN